MCNCIDVVNKRLKEDTTNTKLIIAFSAGRPEHVIVETMKIDLDKRGKAAMVLATYCPFCGQKYEVEHEDTLEKEVEKRR